jgi:hypothetical protein
MAKTLVLFNQQFCLKESNDKHSLPLFRDVLLRLYYQVSHHAIAHAIMKYLCFRYFLFTGIVELNRFVKAIYFFRISTHRAD